jgi:hypothetical protein
MVWEKSQTQFSTLRERNNHELAFFWNRFWTFWWA